MYMYTVILQYEIGISGSFFILIIFKWALNKILTRLLIGSANITALGYSTQEVAFLHGIDFPTERMIFDWRTFSYYAPIEDDLDHAVNLTANPSLYPRVYGVKCRFTYGLEIVMPENLDGEGVTWLFPFSMILWRPVSYEEQIYSQEGLPEGAYPEGCAESLTFKYAGKYISFTM